MFSVLALALMLPLAHSQSDSDYVLGPDDVITITVVRHPEFSGDFLVPSAGVITAPVVGTFKATGMTLGDTNKMVTKKMATRLRAPEVAVTLKFARVKKISVVGAVTHPGPYEWKPGWKVNEALGAGGGIPPGADPRDFKASILRASDGTKVPISIPDALNGDPANNLPIYENDVLTVDAAQLVPVFVSGRVKSPGRVDLKQESVGVMESLSLAGGVMDDAQISSVSIIHSNHTQETVDLTPLIVRGEKISLPTLQANDMIVVPQADARIGVFGTVAAPGFVPIPEGRELRLSDAIGAAKPDPKKSRLARVGLIRTVNGKQVRTTYDFGKFVKNGDLKYNPVLQSGDVVYVPESDAFDWTTVAPGLSLAALLFQRLK